MAATSNTTMRSTTYPLHMPMPSTLLIDSPLAFAKHSKACWQSAYVLTRSKSSCSHFTGPNLLCSSLYRHRLAVYSCCVGPAPAHCMTFTMAVVQTQLPFHLLSQPSIATFYPGAAAAWQGVTWPGFPSLSTSCRSPITVASFHRGTYQRTKTSPRRCQWQPQQQSALHSPK